MERGLPVRDFAGAVDGHWIRGETDIIRADATRLPPFMVQFTPSRPEERCTFEPIPELGESSALSLVHVRNWKFSRFPSARDVVKDLLVIGRDPMEDLILEFVQRYGPLMDFGRWARSLPMYTSCVYACTHPQLWREGAKNVGQRYRLQEGDNILPDLTTLRLTTGGDVADFIFWCVENGHRASAWYTAASVGRVAPYIPIHDETLEPEPVALYAWAARRLATVEEQLRMGRKLDRDIGWWVSARLRESYPILATEPGKLQISSRSLLGYLVLETILAATGNTPYFRQCLDPRCRQNFQVKDGRQRFCSKQCGNRYRKEQQRRRLNGD